MSRDVDLSLTHNVISRAHTPDMGTSHHRLGRGDLICDVSPTLCRFDLIVDADVLRLAAIQVDGRMFAGSAKQLARALRDSRSAGCDVFKVHRADLEFIRAPIASVTVLAAFPASR